MILILRKVHATPSESGTLLGWHCSRCGAAQDVQDALDLPADLRELVTAIGNRIADQNRDLQEAALRRHAYGVAAEALDRLRVEGVATLPGTGEADLAELTTAQIEAVSQLIEETAVTRWRQLRQARARP